MKASPRKNMPASPPALCRREYPLEVKMAIIVCGYGYVIIYIFIKDTLVYILIWPGLTGLSFLFSFMAFKDNNMWADSPDLTLSVITGSFAATVIFYMFYFLSYSFCRMGTDE